MTSPTQTVQAFLGAFARHDVDALLVDLFERRPGENRRRSAVAF